MFLIIIQTYLSKGVQNKLQHRHFDNTLKEETFAKETFCEAKKSRNFRNKLSRMTPLEIFREN